MALLLFIFAFNRGRRDDLKKKGEMTAEVQGNVTIFHFFPKADSVTEDTIQFGLSRTDSPPNENAAEISPVFTKKRDVDKA